MMKMYAQGDMAGMLGDGQSEGMTLILNANHPLVQYILENEDAENQKLICEQLYDLARVQNAPLSGDEMTAFINRSNEIMMLMTGK